MKGGEIMRKALLVTLVLSLVMGIASMAWANQFPKQDEKDTYKWDSREEKWVLQEKGQTADARAWGQTDPRSPYYFDGILIGGCNKKNWDIDVSVHASVAQWIKWKLSNGGWQIRVRKPGRYTTNCIEARLNSNANVVISFEGFDDLESLEKPGEFIETWYAWDQKEDGSPLDPNDPRWIKAPNLNNLSFEYDFSGCEQVKKLWIMILVRDDHYNDRYRKTRACEYQDDAKIKLTLTVIKNWIDPDTGLFKELQPEMSWTVTQ